MAIFKKKSKSIISRLRNYFLTGIVVLVPIGITLYLTKFIISISSKLVPAEINPNNYLPFSIPGLEIILSIIFITFIGGLSLSFIGKKILQVVNDLFKKIPFQNAAKIFKNMITKDDFDDFLTLPLYEKI